MTKRMASFVLALALFVPLLAACGNNQPAAPAATTAPAAPAATTAPAAPAATAAPAAPVATPAPLGDVKKIEVEPNASIVFWSWGASEAELNLVRQSIENFKKIYPEVTVDFQPTPADYETKLKAAIAGGTGPDVFYINDSLMTALGPTGQLAALDEAMAAGGVTREEFIPALLTIFTNEGKTYGLPKDWGTLGLIYLPEAFADAGIPEPTSSWTWDDLAKAAKTIGDKGTYAGFCQNADWARFAPFAFSYGGSFVSDDLTKATINTPEIKQAAEFVMQMKNDNSLKTASDLSAGWCGEAIGKKLAAITLEGGWMVNFMKENYKDVQWKAVSLPNGPKGQAGVIFTNAIAANAKAKFPKASAALVLYLTGRNNQAFVAENGLAYPSRADDLGLVTDPNDSAIAQAYTFPGTRVAYWGPNTGKVNEAINQALNRVYLGDQTVEEAFTQAQDEIQAALDTR
jgi:multiple sugar transport system substrate-binding protein